MTTKPKTPQELWDELSPEQQEAILDANLKGREAPVPLSYEEKRDDMVIHFVTEAKANSERIAAMKKDFEGRISRFKEQGKAYAKYIGKANYKGNMTIYSKNMLSKVVYNNNEVYEYDERAITAEALLREYMDTMVTEGNKVIYDLIQSLLQRKGKNGNLDPRQISKLYKYENEIDNESFKQAIQLFKDAYQYVATKSYMRIYERATVEAEWQMIVLDFSSI